MVQKSLLGFGINSTSNISMIFSSVATLLITEDVIGTFSTVAAGLGARIYVSLAEVTKLV